MTEILITFIILSLWLQVHCQGVTQYPEATWTYVSKSAVMNCSHNKDVRHNQMYWYRQRPGETMRLIVFTAFGGQPDYGGAPATKYSAIKDNTESGALTVNNLQLEDSGVYFCAVSDYTGSIAYFGKGTKLTVLEKDREPTAPTVKVLQPSPQECRNQKENTKKKTLVCVAHGFYPDHVSVFWEIDGENVTKGVATDHAALRPEGDEFYRITSRLRVTAKVWHTANTEFKCTVSFFNGTTTEYYTHSIRGEEAAAAEEVMTREKYLRITQAAKLSYSVFIAKSSIYGAFVAFLVWKLQGSTGKQND